MFTCKRCGEPLFMKRAELKDKILKMETQCLNGHKSVRRLSEDQAQEVASDIFDKVYVCLDCGSDMKLLGAETSIDEAEGSFLCPIHGPQRREFPSLFLPKVTLLGADVDSERSIIDSFKCHECGQVYAVSDIEERDALYEVSVRCANGHKDKRYISKNTEEGLLRRIVQRTMHCTDCGLPGNIAEVEERKNSSRVHVACPVHGIDKKDIPKEVLPILQDAAEEIPEDAVVKAMLVSSRTGFPLAIREIEDDKPGYKFKCIDPKTGDTTSRVVPMTWGDSVKKRITTAVMTCDECGLYTHLLEARKKRNHVDFKVVCPIHGVQDRKATPEVFEYVTETEGEIDRVPSIVRSLSCTKCRMPLNLRDVEDRRGLIEFDVECRNGHQSYRFFVPGIEHETLVDLYKNFYKCPECYGPLELVYTKPAGRENRVVLLCSLHGKFTLDIPPDHADAMSDAYEELKKDRLKPPKEAPEPEPVKALDEPVISPEEPEVGVKVLRGCEIVGGKFDYKVKVVNDSGYVITNVTVSIVAFPKDCMEVGGETVKTISRIEVGGFRSPQFSFYPTKDCVQGKIVATVSYIDYRDHLHTMQVEPYLIRSVCDLLKPSEATSKEFDLVLDSLTTTKQEQTLDWNAQVLFTKAEKLLPVKNFHIVDTEEKMVGGAFVGTIRGYAEGKYTGKKVAVIFLISGPENGRHASIKVEAMGEDISMLPTTIDELAESMDSWICLRCGAPLDSDQIAELGTRLPIRCHYCAHTLTIALYLR